jgi:predicted NUDIX family NTP pyrophosphohydrolase
VPRRSAGLLPFRAPGGEGLELFLVHPGGPLWANKDDHAWSIAKGEYDGGEEASAAAEREFAEELGVAPPPGPRVDLGEIKQPSGKLVRVWAIQAATFDLARVVSNDFELEWPPKSGLHQRFPEVDRAEWMSEGTARRKMVKGQVAFIDRLVDWLGGAGPGGDAAAT